MGFFGSLFGSDQEKAIKKAKKKSDAELQAGYDQAQPFYDQAFDLYQPYAQSGTDAQNRYNQLLGLGTSEERAAGQRIYMDDPIFGAILNDQSNALLRQQNARGATYGGQTVQMAGRLGLENYNNYLNRLQGLGSQGFQAANQQATLRSGQGDMRYGLGVTKAGAEQNYGSAIAQAKTQGINNLLGLGSTILKGVSLFSDRRLKRDVIRIGALPSGLPLYRFKYLEGDSEFVGVMAQEALSYAPAAVEVDPSGYLKIDYSLIS